MVWLNCYFEMFLINYVWIYRMSRVVEQVFESFTIYCSDIRKTYHKNNWKSLILLRKDKEKKH